jgi:transposase InsO family protein
MYDHKTDLPIDSKTKEQHLLTIVEVLSGFVWAFPSKTLTSTELVNQLKYFYRVLPRRPQKVFLDNGSNFISKEHHQLLTSLKIQIIHGTPGHSRGRGKFRSFSFNLLKKKIGLVEQKHRCLVDPLMKLYQEDESGQWAKYLPQVVDSYNSTVRRPNTCSPKEFLFGIENENLLPGNTIFLKYIIIFSYCLIIRR